MRSFFISALAAIAPLVSAQIGGHCDPVVSESNPLAKQYTTQSTGTINSTVLVLPITYSAARAIIPSKYKILTSQYAQWLPNLGSGNYPAILQMELHHDIYNKGKSAGAAGDYLRASVSFPFVDRLGDGYSSFMYSTELIISESATSVQSALAGYGYTVAPGYFSTCNAYEYENGTTGPPAKRGIDQAAWAETNTDLSNPDIAYRVVPANTSPYPNNNFFYNVTNQPLFSNTGANCDKVVRLFNTDVSLAPFAPKYVTGDAAVLGPFYPGTKTVFAGVSGLKLDVAYHEQAPVACSTLKGYHVVTAPSS